MDEKIAARFDAMERTIVALVRVAHESDPLAGRYFVDQMNALKTWADYAELPLQKAAFERMLNGWLG
jgi:peptide deformylase